MTLLSVLVVYKLVSTSIEEGFNSVPFLFTILTFLVIVDAITGLCILKKAYKDEISLTILKKNANLSMIKHGLILSFSSGSSMTK